MLNAHKVSVHRGGRALLDGFTARFAPAELAMVVGANGAGKTTLLRCLNGELPPTHGSVEFARRPLAHWSRVQLARARAVLPQQSSLDFPFIVGDVALMGRMPHATSAAENRAIAAEALALCDCAHLTARAYTSLSGGEQQRVQIARVIAQIYRRRAAREPECEPEHERFLLLDEPVAALDLSHQYALMRLLKRLQSEHKIGIVCALHNLNLVAQFADRALVMQRGKLVADGAPLEVFTESLMREVFNLEVAVQRHPENNAIPLLIPRLTNDSNIN